MEFRPIFKIIEYSFLDRDITNASAQPLVKIFNAPTAHLECCKLGCRP